MKHKKLFRSVTALLAALVLMGVGMVLTVPAEQADKALEILHANGEPEAYRLGVIAEGEGVELC